MKVLVNCLKVLQAVLFGGLIVSFLAAMVEIDGCYNWTAVAITAIDGLAFGLISTLIYHVDPFLE